MDRLIFKELCRPKRQRTPRKQQPAVGDFCDIFGKYGQSTPSAIHPMSKRGNKASQTHQPPPTQPQKAKKTSDFRQFNFRSGHLILRFSTIKCVKLTTHILSAQIFGLEKDIFPQPVSIRGILSHNTTKTRLLSYRCLARCTRLC